MSSIQRTIKVSFEHRVHFTHNVFAPDNSLLKNVLAEGSAHRIKALVVLDEALSVAQPELAKQIEQYFTTWSSVLQLVCPPVIIEGGERTKNSYFHVSEIHSQIDRHHIDLEGAR